MAQENCPFQKLLFTEAGIVCQTNCQNYSRETFKIKSQLLGNENHSDHLPKYHKCKISEILHIVN